MLKKLLTVCLLIALISSNFSRFFIYAGFELNHKYIAENLCVNKGRPWLHCNGKCYFMKKVRQSQENEKKQDRADQKTRLQDALSATAGTNAPVMLALNQIISYPYITTPKTVERPQAILLPPKIV